MSRKIRIGVLGVGSLGQHHARIYSEMEGVEFVAVCDVDARRAQDIAAKIKTRSFAFPERRSPASERARSRRSGG